MTQISEAKQESDVTNQPKLVYCIQHETMVKAELFECGAGHLHITDILGENPEIDVCLFPSGYAYCPPPDEFVLPLDWADQPDQIGEDERALTELEEIGAWLS